MPTRHLITATATTATTSATATATATAATATAAATTSGSGGHILGGSGLYTRCNNGTDLKLRMAITVIYRVVLLFLFLVLFLFLFLFLYLYLCPLPVLPLCPVSSRSRSSRGSCIARTSEVSCGVAATKIVYIAFLLFFSWPQRANTRGKDPTTLSQCPAASSAA